MRLVIKDNADEVAEWVANYVVARIKGFNPTEERPFVLGLPTGSSPLAAYKKVRRLHSRQPKVVPGTLVACSRHDAVV